MDEHGRSTFSEDQNGRILDRLAGLEKVISQEQITNGLTATNKQSVRRCKLTNEIMILAVLAMGLFTELPIRQVFKACRRLVKGGASPCRSALCIARQRLVQRLMTNLMDADEFPAMELIMEYHERWEEEIVYDEQKTHQDPCRAEKTTHLRSETSDGLKQELYALSLGHFITRTMMLEAAKSANSATPHGSPRAVSFDCPGD